MPTRTRTRTGRLDLLARSLQENARLAVDAAAKMAWIDLGELEDENAGADDEEGERDGEDGGCGGFKALVKDDGSDEGEEGEEDVVSWCNFNEVSKYVK